METQCTMELAWQESRRKGKIQQTVLGEIEIHTPKKKNVLTAYTKIDSREFNGQI